MHIHLVCSLFFGREFPQKPAHALSTTRFSAIYTLWHGRASHVRRNRCRYLLFQTTGKLLLTEKKKDERSL